MVLSFAVALNVSAAGEGYTITAGNYTFNKRGAITAFNTGASDTHTYYATSDDFDNETNSTEKSYIALNVVTATAGSGGYVAIDYDETKVTPVYCDGYGMYPASTGYDWASFDLSTATVTDSANATAISDGKMVVTWYNSVSADSTVFTLAFVLNDGITTDNFDKDTFKIVTDESFMNTYKLRNGGASLDTKEGTFKLNENTLTVSITYPNSDKGDEPQPSDWKTTTDATEAGFNTAQDIQFRTETAKDASDAANGNSADIKSKVVIFAKNTTGDTLAPQTYGIQIGNAFYPGVGTVSADQYWAIILVDTTDSKLTVGTTYNYSAKINGTEIGTGTATVQ